jgi:hypothetical protein
MGASIENNECRYMADLTNFIWRFNSDMVSGSLKRGIRNMEGRYSEVLLYVRPLVLPVLPRCLHTGLDITMTRYLRQGA